MLPEVTAVVPVAGHPVDGIRQRLKVLRGTVSRTQAEMAALLYQVYERRLFIGWGHKSFVAYVLEELELLPRFAYRAVETYRAFEPEWERAALLPWNRLTEAVPLISQGSWTAEITVEALEDASVTVRVIRDWKARALRVGEPAVVSAGEGRVLKIVPSPKAGEPDVVIHPDMELIDAWQTNGTAWVKVTMTLPQSVLLLLVETCGLARGRLNIDRDPDDDRWTLPRELEALCQEVAMEWRAQHQEEMQR